MKICEQLRGLQTCPQTTGAINEDGIQNTTVESVNSKLAEQLESLSTAVTSFETKLDAAINKGSMGGNVGSSSTTSTVAVEAVVHTLEGNNLSTIPKTFEMSNRTNIMDAWRMWWSGSRRCGENKDKLVRPFKDINDDHFNFTADCQKNKRAWRVWKHVMEYLASKLDELKEKRIYDWSTADPVNPKTLMFVAQIVPAAPPKAGGRKRQVIPSKNSVGTVRKNMSLLSLCAAE